MCITYKHKQVTNKKWWIDALTYTRTHGRTLDISDSVTP